MGTPRLPSNFNAYDLLTHLVLRRRGGCSEYTVTVASTRATITAMAPLPGPASHFRSTLACYIFKVGEKIALDKSLDFKRTSQFVHSLTFPLPGKNT